MEFAGVIYDFSPHYLDHLAPLCSLLQVPLIVCEPQIQEQAKLYYPDLQLISQNVWELTLPQKVLSCTPKALLQAAFPKSSFDLIWLPHGSSDKGKNAFFFEALKEEKLLLIYGEKMKETLVEKGVLLPTFSIGNFRLDYFLQKKSFYDRMVAMPQGVNFFYAPTWEDQESSSSFWNSFPLLAKATVETANLIVKLHPNTIQKHGPEIEILIGKCGRKNIFFLFENLPIYPLLSQISAYIGDMSSIGYDCLAFDFPMYFLEKKWDTPLHSCGFCIDPKTFDFSLKKESRTAQKKSLYEKTFAKHFEKEALFEAIRRA